MNSRELKYLLLIVIAYIAACIETDIFLPAFPDMMDFFDTSEEVVQSLLTWNFIGVCLSGPFYGPISDAFGRRNPLIFALGIFTLGSLITLYADSFAWVLFGRVFQGVGSGGCFTLGTAIIFDVFRKEKAVHAINFTSFLIPLVMTAAPMIGAYLNKHYGFRSNFFTILIFSFLSFALCNIFFKESLPKEKRTVFAFESVKADFIKVLGNRGFWELSLVIGFLFAAYFVFLFQQHLFFTY